MAKKKKDNTVSFATFLAELKSKAIEGPKPVETKEEKKYFLIVSEGERTEPEYFNYFKKFLPKNFLDTVEVHGAGDNTINIVRQAINLKTQRENDVLLPNYDECWAVFDKDDFPDQNFNSAVTLASQNSIGSAHSNQSFELWYVLHFQYLNTCIHRSSYYKILDKHLGFKYSKKSLKVVEYLFRNGNIEQAIEWAKTLELNSAGLSPSNSCPTTSVYKLVESLRAYCLHDS